MRKLTIVRLLALALFFSGVIIDNSLAAISCPSGVLSQPKGNSLYLYFPTSSDSGFLEYGVGDTSPLAPFDVADLDSGIGTTAQLRDRIFELVTDDYCEFNVKVQQTTSAPSPSESRWQIVGLGTDSETYLGGPLFGEAQAVDTNDAESQDYARVWAKSFKDAYGGTGEALEGTDSTLERWATAIGETTAHEAGHNYGAGHGHSAPRTGSAEDEQNNHIMATGSTGLTGEIRASRDRHFSDTAYEILGHNIGLNVKTLHNWDFINPNDTSANGMRIKLLTTASSLSIGWWYNGSRSPWQNPTVTNTGATQSFQGTTYNVFNLDFTSAKSWSGSTAGVVEAGDEFHTGASFTGSDSVIVFKVELFNGSISNASNRLPLSPRLPGYDAGTADLASGDFSINFFNTDPFAGDLIITNVQINRIPRMMDINAMISGADPVDIRGLPVQLTSAATFVTHAAIVENVKREMKLRDKLRLPIGKLTDKRSVDIVYGPKDCPPGSIGSGTSFPGKKTGATRSGGVGDAEGEEVLYCAKGNALSLFPSTYTYIIATVVQPNATYWDKAQSKFVTGPLASQVFYQVGGIVPDFNHNGTDDLIDIRTGVSPDINGNGVPDEAEKPIVTEDQDHDIMLWLLLLLAIILLLLILLWPRR